MGMDSAAWLVEEGAASPEGLGLWCSTVMGEEGAPQGVLTVIWAAGVKPGMEERPVPPMTAMRMGSMWVSQHFEGH